MKLPKFKKKFVVGAVAAGLVMGAGGVAFAYIGTTGTGTGSASVKAPSHVSVTVQTLKTKIGPNTTPVHVSFSVTNPNGYTVTLGAATISFTTNGKCGTTAISVTDAATAIGKVTHGVTTVTTASKTPTLTFKTTPGATQATCSVSLKITV